MKIIYEGPVVGITFEPAKSNFRKLIKYLKSLPSEEIDPQILLVPDPKNKFDPNAIRVSIQQGEENFEIGWVPTTHNATVLGVGIGKIQTDLLRFNIMDETIAGATIRIRVI